jgi:hypothetical protein
VQRRSAEETASDDNVRSILETVTAGQKSDSSIELVLPRRPRPAGLPPVAAPRPAAEPPAAPPVQRMPLREATTQAEQPYPAFVPGQPSEGFEPSEGVDSGPAATAYQPALAAATPPVVQRAAAPPATPTPAMPHMVPTEIGELPSDLWQLLGATPPAPAASAPAGNGAMLQRQVTAAPQPATPAPTRQYISPAVVQRAETTAATAARAEPAATTRAPAEGEGEGEKKSEVDVDELSRQVLQVIRRRLAVEWERSRGRF